MAEISAFILAYNETETIPELMESLKGIRDVVVLDNGSTDGTQELFRKLGARVYDGTGIGKWVAEEADVAAFEKEFGFAPGFVVGDKFDHSGARRNHAATLCRNDWVLNLDCDERVEWDLKKIKAMLKDQGGIRHRFIHKHNPDGSPLVEFVQCKLFNRQKAHFVGLIHEVVVSRETGLPAATNFCPDIAVHHFQRPNPDRERHMQCLEFQASKEITTRNLYYLAREYVTREQWEKAIVAFGKYFGMNHGDFRKQRSQARMYQAECYRALKQEENTILAYHQAMIEDDTDRAPFFMLGTYYLKQEQFQKALIYFNAANSIPYNPQGYSNDMRLYTWGVHDKLSVCYQRLGVRELAQKHWLEALKYLPEDQEGARILSNGRWIMKKAEL